MKTKSIDIKAIDEAEGKVSAVFATFGVKDHDGDVTLPGAFRDGQEVRLSAYNHASWGPGALPVGKGVIRTTDSEAIFDGQFFLTTTAGRDTFEVVKELGTLGEWSYGFDVIDSERGTHDGEQVNFLKTLDVHEVSPVILGAGIGTRTLAAKSRKDLKFIEHIDTVLADVEELTTRAAEVMAMRQEKGKSLGEDAKASLERLEPALKTLDQVLNPVEADTANQAALVEFERSRQLLRR